MRSMWPYIVSSCLIGLMCGCSNSQRPPQSPTIEYVTVAVPENALPGTERQAWVEPMHDTVEVPGQVDPTGVYYRAPHRTIYEIRPGRYQEVQFPDDKEK